MAISRLILSICSGFASRRRHHQRCFARFRHRCDPTAEDTWCVAADGAAAAGLHIHPDGAMLDLSGGPLSHQPSAIHQTEAILCHILTHLLICFIREQMLMWRRCRWESENTVIRPF